MALKYSSNKANSTWQASFHPVQNVPLDDRTVVEKKTDLTDINTWGSNVATKVYKGLQVFCEEDNKTYVFTGNSISDISNNKCWGKVGSGDSGIPLLDTAKLQELDEVPDYYVNVPNPDELDDTTKIEKGTTVSTGVEGTYLDILFQAVRKLQTEVTRLSSTFKRGIVSYTDTNTASTQEFITSAEEEIKEPLWAISQDDMTTLEEINIDPTGVETFEPANNVSSKDGSYLQIGSNATHSYSGEVITDSYAQQSNYIIIQQSSQGEVVCKNVLSDGTEIDYTSLYDSLKDKTRYNIFTLIGRKEQESSGNSSTYKNYIYISITNIDNVIVKQGYLNNQKLQDAEYLFSTPSLLYFKEFTGANCYLYTLLTGSRDCGYSDYSDIPQPPEDTETFTYKAAHIAIRSVKNKTTLDSIKNRLLSNELIWVEDTSKLYILTNNNLIQIGSSSSGDDDKDMTDIAQWLKDEKLITGDKTGAYYLNSARLNDISSITFKHEGSGKTFNISVQTNGTLKSQEIKSDITPETTPSDTSSFTIRGAAARYSIGENLYKITDPTLNGGTLVKTTEDTTTINGDRIRISKWYVPIDGQTAFNCSHDFIELANSGTFNYPLDNAYLHLCILNNGKYSDKVYKLSGYIPAEGTYLIRAKQRLNLDSDIAYVKVDSYDVELWDNKELQDLEGVQAIFILNGESNPQDFTTDSSSSFTLAKKDNCRPDLIDVVVLSKNNTSSPLNLLSTYTYKNTAANVLQKDLYFLDPAKQAFKTLGSQIGAEASNARVNATTGKVDCENIKLDTDTVEFYHSSETKPVSLYKPHASYEKANVCTDKTRLNIDKPNAINCAFGINGWTTRCFNWVSVGENDEYIWVRKKSDNPDPWTKTNRFESYKKITADSTSTSSLYPQRVEFNTTINNAVYARMVGNFPANGQHYTAHKVILKIVENAVSSKTTYEYIVGRSHLNGTPNLDHCSDIRTFTLYPNTYDPVVIQTTDQQGFTWMEYQTWAAAANYLNDTEIPNSCFESGTTNFPVLLNTGDMTQNGTRVNEWLDYFNAAECLFSKYEFMHVVGNNDLVNSYNAEFLGTGNDDGKSSPYYFHVFFCYEIDQANPSDFPSYSESNNLPKYQRKWQHPLIYNNIYVPSMYYFGFPTSDNTGKGFLMINSEITVITNCIYFQKLHKEYSSSDEQGKCTINIYTGKQKPADGSITDKWSLKQTIEYMITQVQFENKVPAKNVIVACHEMPFTVITQENLKNDCISQDRSLTYKDNTPKSLVGSHLNVLDYNAAWLKDDIYWFSKLIQQRGIKLCIGGHKHSYCSTYPIHEYDSTIDSTDSDYSDYSDSRKCKIFIKSPASYNSSPSDDYHKWNTTTTSPKTAVVYFMCQATGYKQKSNKELPGSYQNFSKVLPDTTFKDDTASADLTQQFPMYAVFTYGTNNINIALKRIANIQNETESKITQLSETAINTNPMYAETCLIAWNSTKYKPYWYDPNKIYSSANTILSRVTYSNSNWKQGNTSIEESNMNPDIPWSYTSPITDIVSLS